MGHLGQNQLKIGRSVFETDNIKKGADAADDIPEEEEECVTIKAIHVRRIVAEYIQLESTKRGLASASDSGFCLESWWGQLLNLEFL